MKNEVISAGCVVFRKADNSIYILLIHKKWRRNNESWVFPKGRLEQNETREQAAFRETVEETGVVQLKLLSYLTNYSFTTNQFRKTIYWYLAQTKEEMLAEKKLGVNELKTQIEEKWVKIEELENYLSFQRDIELIPLIKTKIEKIMLNSLQSD